MCWLCHFLLEATLHRKPLCFAVRVTWQLRQFAPDIRDSVFYSIPRHQTCWCTLLEYCTWRGCQIFDLLIRCWSHLIQCRDFVPVCLLPCLYLRNWSSREASLYSLRDALSKSSHRQNRWGTQSHQSFGSIDKMKRRKKDLHSGTMWAAKPLAPHIYIIYVYNIYIYVPPGRVCRPKVYHLTNSLGYSIFRVCFTTVLIRFYFQGVLRVSC